MKYFQNILLNIFFSVQHMVSILNCMIFCLVYYANWTYLRIGVLDWHIHCARVWYKITKIVEPEQANFEEIAPGNELANFLAVHLTNLYSYNIAEPQQTMWHSPPGRQRCQDFLYLPWADRCEPHPRQSPSKCLCHRSSFWRRFVTYAIFWLTKFSRKHFDP